MNEIVTELADERKETEDDSGYLYDLHERTRDILAEYNDTVRGRCAVCLENFCVDSLDEANGTAPQANVEDEKFTDRVDLIRISDCYHKFHLVCVYRDWFMPRFSEKDEYGGEIKFSIPEVKRCPICRREVDIEEIDYIKKQFSLHPETDDGGYLYEGYK